MPVAARKKLRPAYRGPGCPRCGDAVQTEGLAEGHYTCPRCGQRFAMTPFVPPDLAAAPAIPFDAAAGAPCGRHARNAAVATCERCGAFMCALCRVDAAGMALCPDCFMRLGQAGELADTRLSYRHYNGLALHLSVLGLVAWPLGPLLGPLAIWNAIQGRRQGKKFGDTLGSTGAVVALGLGALETIGGTLIDLLAFGGFRR